jgi:hypothetical protein
MRCAASSSSPNEPEIRGRVRDTHYAVVEDEDGEEEEEAEEDHLRSALPSRPRAKISDVGCSR